MDKSMDAKYWIFLRDTFISFHNFSNFIIASIAYRGNLEYYKGKNRIFK